MLEHMEIRILDKDKILIREAQLAEARAAANYWRTINENLIFTERLSEATEKLKAVIKDINERYHCLIDAETFYAITAAPSSEAKKQAARLEARRPGERPRKPSSRPAIVPNPAPAAPGSASGTTERPAVQPTGS